VPGITTRYVVDPATTRRFAGSPGPPRAGVGCCTRSKAKNCLWSSGHARQDGRAAPASQRLATGFLVRPVVLENWGLY
jgi:hypothetical protein